MVTYQGDFVEVGDEDYYISNNDRTIVTAASLTVSHNWYLPPAAGFNAGEEVLILDAFGTCSNVRPLFIYCTDGDFINGRSSLTFWPLTNFYAFLRVRSNGRNGWVITAQNPVDVQIFTSSGTFWKHPEAKVIDLFIWGAGGGGGGGRRGAAGTPRYGGGGGAAGGFLFNRIYGTGVGASAAITIGSGGSSGSGRTTDNASGFAGGAGGTSQVLFGTGINDLYYANGGGGGGGGGSAAYVLGGVGVEVSAWPYRAVVPAWGGASILLSVDGAYMTLPHGLTPQPATTSSTAGGGGSGDGIDTDNIGYGGLGTGGEGSYGEGFFPVVGGQSQLAASVGGDALITFGGGGGGAGGASDTGLIRTGAQGGEPGGGGGGGAAAPNGTTSGSGGFGRRGRVVIVTYR